MNPKLKDFLTDDYRSYNVVQAMSILLALVVIHASPEFDFGAVINGFKQLFAGSAAPLWDALKHQFIALAVALDTPLFWGTLAAYLIALVVSVFIYARHRMSDSPVRASFMLLAIPLLLLIASAARSNLWTAFSIIGPIAVIILTSGFLYNAVLAFIRIYIFPLERRL
ncbi:MAG: hypothetical protein DI628_07405 [Blastochloris viridis]|uniref:Uncharacterized protein n=1 Tax=Blastochloris viridis TaxID=1079 RepID=A0A6N4QZK3_BLAVI|nr:MAG: hypothetical protein DI628_07405 [Blastochloris viridis]